MNAVTSRLLHTLARGPQPLYRLQDALPEGMQDVPLPAWLATLRYQGLIREEDRGQWAITAAGLAQLRGGAS